MQIFFHNDNTYQINNVPNAKFYVDFISAIYFASNLNPNPKTAY